MRTALCAAVAGWAAIGAACHDPADTATVALEVSPFRASADAPLPAAVESGHQAVRVKRRIRVPDACAGLVGDVGVAGGSVTLRVRTQAGGAGCSPGERDLAYTATIQGLRAGHYTLRVVHGGVDGRAPRLVLEHPIVVSVAPRRDRP